MLRQIILKIAFAIIVAFSFTNSASAQLKPSNNSNQVLVDLSVIDIVTTKSLSRKNKGRQDDLLKPPKVTPRSSYLIKPSTTTASRKLARTKIKSEFKLSKKYYKRRKISNKTKLQPSRKRSLNQPSSITKRLKTESKKTFTLSPKRDFKRPIKLSKTNPTEPVLNKKISAPTLKAVPLVPVKILKIPPPTAKIKLMPQQIASRPKKNVRQTTTNLLIFKQGDAKLNNKAIKALDTISKKLKVKPNYRLQIQAYAGEPSLSASNARRLSLSRALSVRSHLIKNGIRSTRIDVRALGNKTSAGEPNRVDLKFIKN
jgi:outer membrane protein OmpA-like peptidoglycan-associated protein